MHVHVCVKICGTVSYVLLQSLKIRSLFLECASTLEYEAGHKVFYKAALLAKSAYFDMHVV